MWTTLANDLWGVRPDKQEAIPSDRWAEMTQSVAEALIAVGQATGQDPKDLLTLFVRHVCAEIEAREE